MSRLLQSRSQHEMDDESSCVRTSTIRKEGAGPPHMLRRHSLWEKSLQTNRRNDSVSSTERASSTSRVSNPSSEEEAILRAELENEIRGMSIEQLVEQLQTARSAKEVPRSIVVEGRDEDLVSVVSKLTLPGESRSFCDGSTSGSRDHGSVSSRPDRYERIESRSSSRRSNAAARHAKVRNRLPAMRHLPPLPQPSASLQDPSRAQGLHVEMDMNDVIHRGLFSGSLDANGRPSGMGVVKFENNDMYIGDFWSGKMHGRGTLIFDGEKGTPSVLKGDFENNKFVV